MKRRDFFKTTLAAGAVALSYDSVLANWQTGAAAAPDLVAVKGGEPAQMLQEALKAFGGIEKYVKKGQNVVIKPNIGWDKKPEFAANTNPELVSELIKQCLQAGARKVTIFDHTCDNWQRCYANSGIKQAVENAGGVILPGNDDSYYKNEVKLPKGVKLKSAKIHQALLEADVWFNVPVLKHHDGARMSISMKNYMGIVQNRIYFHANNLQQCIADICTWDKKPVLNIIDAYRCLLRNGPQGRSVNDAFLMKALIVSPNIVAADTAAIGLFNQVAKIDINDVGHIGQGEKLNLGTQKLDKLNIKRITL